MNKLLALMLLVCSIAVADELPQPKLQLSNELSEYNQCEPLTSKDLPTPNLILERGLVYTPTTRIRTRIISGGINISEFRAIPESEYWRGN